MPSLKTTFHSDLLLASEVADLFRVSVRTVTRWGHGGKLPPPVKVGGVTRWRREDIERVLKGDSCERVGNQEHE